MTQISKYCLTKNQQVDINDPHGWISVLFDRLVNRYGYTFTALIPTRESEVELKREWVEILKNTPLIRMKIALDRCLEPGSKFLQYPPSPLEFLGLCQLSAEELNIPSLEEAFQAVMFQQTKGNSFLQSIIPASRIYNFRNNQSEKDARREFKPLYDSAKAQALREGRILPKIEKYSDYQVVIGKQTPEEESRQAAYELSNAHEHLNRMRLKVGLPEKQWNISAMDVRKKAFAREDAKILRGESF